MSQNRSTYTPQQRRDAQAAMAERFQSKEVQSSLKIDIDKFTNSVENIGKSFEVVDQKLAEVDALGLDSKKYQPTWAGFKKRYRDLLWESRDLASKIATQSEQFATAMLPIASGKADPSLSTTQRADQMKFFSNMNEKQGKEATEMNEKFSDLANEINSFKASFNSFAAKHLHNVNEQIEDLEAELAGLKKELDDISERIVAMSAGLALIILSSIALCAVFPATVAEIATAGVTAATGVSALLATACDKRAEIASEITTKTKELKDLTQAVKQIEKARADLKNLAETEISPIVAGLTMLADIWRNVDSDCKQIEQYLRAAQNGNEDIGEDPNAPAVLSSFFKKGVSIYTGLTNALRLYAAGIDKAQQ